MAQKDIETCFNYNSREAGYFSSNEPKFINKVRKLAEEHPDEVTILAEPENNDGTIYAKMPISYFRIQAPVRRNHSEEEKAYLRERLRNWREMRQKNRL